MITNNSFDAKSLATDLKIKAAWFYFVEGKTQEQIAQHFGISRLKVLRMLAACKEEGIVKVSIESATAEQVQLEREIEEAYGLHECIVVPASVDEADRSRIIGHAVGHYIASIIEDDTRIGVGWGATLDESLRSIPRRQTKGVSVVSLLGSLVRSASINPSVFAWRMASIFGAESYQLTCPVYVSHKSLRDLLWREPPLVDLRERAKDLNIAIVGVGAVDDTSTIFRHSILPRESVVSLKKAKAVADVLGQFIDAEGALVDHEANERVMAIDLAILQKTPRVTVVAGGSRKTAAIAAALRATRATTLITDTGAAQGLRQLAQKRR